LSRPAAQHEPGAISTIKDRQKIGKMGTVFQQSRREEGAGTQQILEIEMANPRQEDKSAQSFEETARRTGENTAAQSSRIGQAAAEQTSRVGQAAADAGEEVARAGANLLQQNAEALQNTWRFGLDTATAIMGRSTDQLGRTLGLSGNRAQEATERSARNAETVLYASTAATKVVGGMSREYFDLVRHHMEKTMDRMTDLWAAELLKTLQPSRATCARQWEVFWRAAAVWPTCRSNWSMMPQST
jgi:hypothetical protein